MSKRTQNQKVLDWLHLRGPISRWDAMAELRIANLPQRIAELRDAGWLIDTETVKNERTGSTHAEYRLVGRAENPSDAGLLKPGRVA